MKKTIAEMTTVNPKLINTNLEKNGKTLSQL